MGWNGPSLWQEYNFELWPLNANESKSLFNKELCKILNINHQFRKSSLNEFFNQIEFQYSKVRFADKFKNHINNSKNILLVLNTQLSHFVGHNNNTESCCMHISAMLHKGSKDKVFYFSLWWY